MNQQTIALALHAHPLFSGLSPQEIEELAAHCQVRVVQPGEFLFRQEDPSGTIYLVLNGELRMTCSGQGGVEVVVGTVSHGGVLGEMGVLDEAPRSASAVASAQTTALALPGEGFAAMVESGHPGARNILRWVRQQVCQRLRILDERIDAVLDEHYTATPAAFDADTGTAAPDTSATSPAEPNRLRELLRAFSQEGR